MWSGISSRSRLEDLVGRQLSVRSHHVLVDLLGCGTVEDLTALTESRLREVRAGRGVLRDMNDLLASCGLPLGRWSGDASDFARPFDERSVDYLIVDPDLRELLQALGLATIRDLRESTDWRARLEKASEMWAEDCRSVERELARIGITL